MDFVSQEVSDRQMTGRALIAAANLVVDPTRGKRIVGIGDQVGTWYGRVGDYRLLYDIVDHKTVFRRLDHRKCIYGKGRTN